MQKDPSPFVYVQIKLHTKNKMRCLLALKEVCFPFEKLLLLKVFTCQRKAFSFNKLVKCFPSSFLRTQDHSLGWGVAGKFYLEKKCTKTYRLGKICS